MTPYPADVLASGAVLLGDDVVCDGFHRGRPVRVQTHVHDDHMKDFDTSKGFQDLLMSEGTRSLLIAEFNADLVWRDNLFTVGPRVPHVIRSSRVSLFPSGHMLGSVQVLVETNGLRLGYSGDFQWPLEEHQVMQCDVLVVDSTYGSPESVRQYSQDEAEARFLELVLATSKRGPVHVQAHRGTIHRALQIISGNVDKPVLCSDRLCKEIGVYQQFGAAVGSVLSVKSPLAKEVLGSGQYVRLYSKGDARPVQIEDGVSIVLSAFMARRDDPVMEYSERAFRVALSNHADFLGTLAYVEATNAKVVVTDNTRGQGVELAIALRNRLGVDAYPSTNEFHREWGC